jgi:hypothetical protein
MTDYPNTKAPAVQRHAVVQHFGPEQRKALERGDAVSILAQRVPVAVVDFYQRKSRQPTPTQLTGACNDI